MLCLRVPLLTIMITLFLSAASRADEPDAYLQPPQVITKIDAAHRGASRTFQGIPSLARTPGGRLWACWYGGPGGGEDHTNYVVLATSQDDGETWSEETLAIDPDGSGPVRAFDPEFWLDPDNRLWLFWAQAVKHQATKGGVWSIRTETPDLADAKWSQPRRLTDGVMMCKPLVLSTGEWVLPASTWFADDSAKMVVSTNHGATWSVRGACHVPKDVRTFDEHTIIERNDRSLWMLMRTKRGISESVSTDRGKTWPAATPSGIAHPSARFFIRRLKSGHLLLVKHGPIGERIGRSHLTAYVSEDDGKTWKGGLLLDERKGVSYPDGVQSDEGVIYTIYDHDRRGAKEILMARYTEEDVRAGELDSKKSALRQLVNRAGGKSN